MLRRSAAPATLVAAVVTATWLVSGVAGDEIIRCLAYEAGFVALPGMALLWVLRGRRPGLLAAVALGWPLGQTLEILAFSATAALGAQGLFVLYPVVIIAGSGLILWRCRQMKRADVAPAPVSVLWMWVAALALSVGLIYLALTFLPQVPLPSRNGSVVYDPDYPYFIGLIAQALHHWPLTSPGLSGVPLHYEWFVFLHMAAMSQVTHLPIATVAFRLDYVPTIVVIGCQLIAVGRLLGRSSWTGVVAILIVFLLGPLDLTTDAGGVSPFFEGFGVHLTESWTFPFGLMFFLALVHVISERLQAPTWRTRRDLPSWLLITMLMIGASGAKATVLPVIIAGLGLYATVIVVVRRRLPQQALVTVCIGAVVFAVSFLIVYGGGVPGTVIAFFAPLSHTVPVAAVGGVTDHPTLRSLALPFAYLAGLAGGMLALSGMLYLMRRRQRDESSRFLLCVCLFIAGLVIANVAHQSSSSELYFQDTGYVAGALAAAAGLRLAWLDLGTAVPASRRAVLAAFGVWEAVLVVTVLLTSRPVTDLEALAVGYLAFGVGCLVFALAWAIALRARHRSASGALALMLVPAVAATALTSPIPLAPVVHRLLAGMPITVTQLDPQAVRGMTGDLFTALEWLRDHSSVDTVFAVSNHWIDPAQTNGKYYYYSAFSERQVFIEAYDSIRYGITTGLATPAGVNFAARRQLNDRVFNDADPTALRVMTDQYSVRFLLVDRIHGSFDPGVLRLGHIVFSNPDATIMAVGP